nr:hypothetical protein [Tanacetum cinerariifolium]
MPPMMMTRVLVGLLPHHEEGERVDELVEVVVGLEVVLLQNLLPTIVAQVGDQGRGQRAGRNQKGEDVNDHIQGDVRNATEGSDRMGCTYKKFLACNLKEYDGKGCAIVYTCWIEKVESVHDMSGCRDSQRVKYTAGSFFGKSVTWWNFEIHTRGMVAAIEPKTIQKAVQLADTLTDVALRNGSIKKHLEKRENRGEHSNDRNIRDDNKRTRTGNAFATTANPIRGGYTGTKPKCTTCSYHHPPETPFRSCFNCNRFGHFAKDCRVMRRNVNTTNARNPVSRSCFECGRTDHMVNGIYEIDMHYLVPNVNSIYNVSTKRAKHNLDSTYLWHCRLAHIRYLKETMGYYFYFPPKNKIVVAMYAEFFEKNLITQEVSGRAIDLEEIQDEDTSPSKITSKIPMEVEGFEPPQEEVIPIRRKVCKLQRSIYGLEQASRSWNKRFNEKIKKIGFAQTLDEPCAYQKASESNVTFLILYVDDIIIMGNHILSSQSVKDYLGKCFTMKDLGEATFIFKIKIYRDRSKRLIGLGQNAYMDKILKRYKLDNSKRGHIPMQERLDLNKTQGASTPNENPGELHWTVVKNILKYLRNTKDMFLVYGGNPEAELRVDCYCDVRFETDRDDTISQT